MIHGRPTAPAITPGRWLPLLATTVLLATGLAALLTLGPFRSPPPASDARPQHRLRLLVPPLSQTQPLTEELAPVVAYVAQRLNVEIIPTGSPSPAAAWQSLQQGQAKLALLPSAACAHAADQEELEPLVVQSRDPSFATAGLLVARRDRLGRAPDLRQLRLCYADQLDGTSYLLPRLWLRSYGVDPNALPLWHRSGSHEQTLADLAQATCDAAATDAASWARLGHPLLPERGVEVVRTGQLPAACWVAHRTVGPLMNHLTTVLVEYGTHLPQPAGASVASAEAPRGRIGFQAVNTTTYRAVGLAAHLEGLAPP